MRPSQCTHKTRQRERAAVEGRRGLTKVPRSRNCQKKVEKEGSGRTAGGMDQQDGTGKWVTSRRVRLNPPKKISTWRRMGDCLPEGFPPTSRSASCASEYEVAG